uniref:WPP domain-containing protein n=1 Tax=Aegilops tauschii TaxID=37682 RepID=N1QXW4_AEGTA
MGPDELPQAAAAGADDISPFSFSIWPPTQRTRDAVVRRLVDTLAGDTLLCKRYGAVPAADAEPAARAIEAEAFDAAAVTGGAAASVEEGNQAPQPQPKEGNPPLSMSASVEEGIEALQLYSKEVSRRLLDFVKSRSAAAKAEPPSEEATAVKEETSEA